MHIKKVVTLPLQVFSLWLFHWERTFGKICPLSWFGNGCSDICNCAGDADCDDEGLCPNDKCKTFYFGPGCSFRSSSSFSTQNNPANPWMKDDNNATCNPDSTSMSVTINYQFSYVLSWIRVLARNRNNFMNFSITYNGADPCMNEQKYIADTFVDVTCDNFLPVNSLTFTGALVPDFCEIYTSLGAELILKQPPSQSSTGGGGAAGFANDWSSSSCSSTAGTDALAWWYLKLKFPITIAYIRISYQGPVKAYTLEALDANNNVVYLIANTSSARAYSSSYIYMDNKFMAFALKIMASKAVVPEGIAICNLEIFADPVCTDGTWGLECDKKCNCGIDRPCHFATGICARGCRKGKYGLNCALNCSPSCVDGACGFRNGDCLNCAPGTHGPACDEKCDDGFYGANCNNSCVSRCLSVCDKINGTCFCSENYQGMDCMGCKEGWFGVSCNKTCASHCTKDECKQELDKCFSGERTDTTSKNVQEDSSILLYFLIFWPLIVLALLGLLHKKNKKAVESEGVD